MKQLFTASGFLPGSQLSSSTGDVLHFDQYPPFLRVLLTTDGTVTKSLESYFWEPVAVTDVEQGLVTLDGDCESIDLTKGEEVLARTVCLKGEHSGGIYARARSYINLSMLPQAVAESLSAGKIGIGELLRDSGLETYREVLAFGEDRDENGSTTDSVWRTYRIVMHAQPVIEVTESFPLAVFEKHRSV